MIRNDKIKPPATLQQRGKCYWQAVVAEFDLPEVDLPMLRVCCEFLDRAEAARKLIEKNGLTVLDRFDQVKPNPAVEVERQSLLGFVRSCRELGVSTAEPGDSRPPLPRGYR